MVKVFAAPSGRWAFFKKPPSLTRLEGHLSGVYCCFRRRCVAGGFIVKLTNADLSSLKTKFRIRPRRFDCVVAIDEHNESVVWVANWTSGVLCQRVR